MCSSDLVEIAQEREEIEQFLDVMAEEALSDLGEQDFFEPPTPVVVTEEVRLPAVCVPAPVVVPEVVQHPRRPRFILRNDTRRRKG